MCTQLPYGLRGRASAAWAPPCSRAASPSPCSKALISPRLTIQPHQPGRLMVRLQPAGSHPTPHFPLLPAGLVAGMGPACLGNGPTAAMQCARPAANGAMCGAGAACFGVGGAAPGYIAGPRGTGPAPPPHAALSLLPATRCPMPPFACAAPSPAAAASGPPRPGGGAAATWLELGRNPVSALHDFCQAKQWLAPPEQRAAWQPRYEVGWAESATCTARAADAAARVTAPDAKTAKTRAAGQLMRLLCPEYAMMCPTAPPGDVATGTAPPLRAMPAAIEAAAPAAAKKPERQEQLEVEGPEGPEDGELLEDGEIGG